MWKKKEVIGGEGVPLAKEKGDILLLVVFFAFLLFMLFCFLFRAENDTVLSNADPASKPGLTLTGIADGSYQSAWEKWLNDNFYGRTQIVKFHNQLRYSLFHDGASELIGKDGYIFNKEDMRIYTSGQKANTTSQEAFDQYAMKVAEIQDKLAALGKDFVYIITAAKAEVYPEMLPWNERLLADQYAGDDGTMREMLLEALDKYGVNYYDTLPDFQNMKETETFDVFASTGHHWTLTAIAKELGTIFSKISEKTPHIKYPTVAVTDIMDKVYPVDMDLLALQNVYYPRVDVENPEPGSHYSYPVIEHDMSDAHMYWFGTSFCMEVMDALYNSAVDRAFDSAKYSHYWTFLRTRDGFGDTVENYTADTPHGDTGVMRAVADADLVVLESIGLLGLVPTHLEFVDYVDSQLDTFLYRMGSNAIAYRDDDLGVSLDNFYWLEDWGRWTNGGTSSVTLYGDIRPETADDLRMVMDMISYSIPHNAEIYINGTYLTTMEVKPFNDKYTVTIPAALLDADENTIEIKLLEEALSPAVVDGTSDVRYLGVGIYSLILEEGY